MRAVNGETAFGSCSAMALWPRAAGAFTAWRCERQEGNGSWQVASAGAVASLLPLGLRLRRP